MSATWDEELASVTDPATDDQIAIIDQSTRVIARTDISNILALPGGGFWDETFATTSSQLDDGTNTITILEVQAPLLASAKYLYEWIFNVQATAAADLRLRPFYAGNALFDAWGSSSTENKQLRINTTEFPNRDILDVNFNAPNNGGLISISGFLETNNAATLICQFSQLVDVDFTIIGAGTTLTIKRIN